VRAAARFMPSSTLLRLDLEAPDAEHSEFSASRPCRSIGIGGYDDSMTYRFVVQRVRNPPVQE
jgi:hypothetical protein